MLFTELKDKEVVCLSDGARLGLVDDLELDENTARVSRLIIYGRNEMMGLGARLEDVVIEWQDVEKIGSDIILVKKVTEGAVKFRKKKRIGL